MLPVFHVVQYRECVHSVCSDRNVGLVFEMSVLLAINLP
jgi:hypothetical protein